MVRITIPDRYRAGVSLIRKLDAGSAQAIRSALDQIFSQKDENSPFLPNLEESMATAIAKVPSLNKDDLRMITETLLSLYGFKAQREVPLEKFVEEVSDAQESLGSGEVPWSTKDRKEFRDNLTTLLGADMFGLAAKVVDLRTDDERLFCHARILTDLRPVFGPRVEDGPQGMIVVHLLKLGYHDANGKHSEFFVSLDSEDLQTIKRVLSRAEEKSKSLSSYLKNVRLFGVTKE